jgi:hypothetical protein
LTLSCDDYETAEQISPEFCNSVANLIQEAARS